MSLEFGLFLASFVFSMIIGLPIAFCMGFASLVYLVFGDIGNISIVFGRIASALNSYLYTAVAFFILASTLMNTSGITDRIYGFSHALVGHLRGGLAQVNVVGSLIFAGMTGTALGDAAGLGRLEVHAMRSAGYEPAFAGAITIASAVLGPIIPPSMVMIIYAELAEVSIADLFLGGIVPGLVIAFTLMVYIYFAAGKKGPPQMPRHSWHQRASAARRAFLPLLAPVVVVGGLTSGAITPTEAGVVAVVYALTLTALYRETSLKSLMEACREAVLGTAMPLFIVTTALLFSWIVTIEQVPNDLVELLEPIQGNWVLIILLINIILLLAGMVMEGIGVMILMVPILKPIALASGIDLVHLGVFMTINLMIGMITPPVGLLLFVAMQITDCSFSVITRAALPFLIPLGAGLLIVSFLPQTVLFVPNLLLH